RAIRQRLDEVAAGQRCGGGEVLGLAAGIGDGQGGVVDDGVGKGGVGEVEGIADCQSPNRAGGQAAPVELQSADAGKTHRFRNHAAAELQPCPVVNDKAAGAAQAVGRQSEVTTRFYRDGAVVLIVTAEGTKSEVATDGERALVVEPVGLQVAGSDRKIAGIGEA